MGYKILYNYCTTITVPNSSRDLTHLHTLHRSDDVGSGDRIMCVIFQLTNYIVAEYLKFLHHPRASNVVVPLRYH